ncbi:hypothetical protein SAMN05443247_07790 [Bradyrhizobium erythrophlei]|jgi:hypothetical protein|nr:hypothetical protein SAMN05443247_07790 [Bradyrhizobium erythrophlei]
MKAIIASAGVALLFVLSGSGIAQTVLKKEPMMMNRGTVVLVDDGSCPKGHIKQVTAQGATGSIDSPYGAVTKKCIQAASTKQ